MKTRLRTQMRPWKTAMLTMRTPVKQAREKYKGATIVLIAVVKQARDNQNRKNKKERPQKRKISTRGFNFTYIKEDTGDDP